MDTSIFKYAEDKRFTDFSNAVKNELKTKLADREEIKTYISDFEKVQKMKTMFSQINKDFGPEQGSEEE